VISAPNLFPFSSKTQTRISRDWRCR
jgi:hypothetical protein